MTPHPGLLRTAPLQGETTASLICRIADRYGLEAKVLRSCWQWRNYPPTYDGGGARADAEVLLNTPARQLLAGLCGVTEDVLARALPSWGQEDAKLSAGENGVPAAAWRTGGAVAGPVAFGCRLCTARRTGAGVRVVRYAPRWERVCVRHGRWLLDADADQPLEHLDLRGVPEVAAAQRRWTGVARRAVRAGAGPERVFALAHAVVARWWPGGPCGRGGCTRSPAVTPGRIWSGGGSWGGTRSSSPRWWPSPTRCWTRPWPSWRGWTAAPGGRGRCPPTVRSAAGSVSGSGGGGWGRWRRPTTAAR